MENVGTLDRWIRIIVAIILAVLGYLLNAWWLYIIAAIALLTAIFGWCGLYALFKWNTAKAKPFAAAAKRAAKKRKR